MTQYTLQPEIVRDCLQRLLDARINRTFLYYLCLQQQSAFTGRQSGLTVPYKDFLDAYFSVEGPDLENSYFVPFTDGGSPVASRWLATDMMKTYSPALLPSASPLMRVANVDTEEETAEWELTDEHWKGARFELCGGNQVPVESLAAYLFRDYAFRTEEPSAVTVVQTFVREFGYQLGGRAFSHLYRTSDSQITSEAFEIHD